MTDYFRASAGELSESEVRRCFEESSPYSWLFDSETKSFTYRTNLLIRLVPADGDAYALRYGHQDVGAVSSAQMDENAILQDSAYNALKIQERLGQTVRFIGPDETASQKLSESEVLALQELKKGQRIFAVLQEGKVRYPAFQFSSGIEPLPNLAQLLAAIPKACHGWPLLSWFEAGNAFLDFQKPADCLATRPQAVLTAAWHFYSTED